MAQIKQIHLIIFFDRLSAECQLKIVFTTKLESTKYLNHHSYLGDRRQTILNYQLAAELYQQQNILNQGKRKKNEAVIC